MKVGALYHMTAPVRQSSTHSTNFTELTPAQAQVVAALAKGSTITAAADSAGVHRATVHNWFKECKPFRAAIDDARDESQEELRDEIKDLYALALKTLKDLLQDPKASPSVRLKAAIAVITRPGWILPPEVKRSLEQDLKKQFEWLEKGLPNPLFGAPSQISRPARA